jgi:transposase
MSSLSHVASIGVGIDTARYGHRVSFLRPDRQPAAKALTVLENQQGYQALQERLQALHQQHPDAHFHIRIDAAGQYAANLEQFLRGLALPMTLSIGEPKRNKDYQKAHFPKRTTDDTESQAMARFAIVEQPQATAAPAPAMAMLREIAGRLQAQVKQTTQAINRLHNLLARVFPELATHTKNFAAGWVLHLLHKYPTAAHIAQARLGSLEKIPFLPQDKAKAIHEAARQSVGSLHGELTATLVRELVAQVRQSQKTAQQLRKLLQSAYAELPPSGHLHLLSIPGIGASTAAILVAKIVDIERFATAENLVGYFGVFPHEESSGVDAEGRPLPVGTLHMSHKGNDLARAHLWNAAFSAIQCNPAVRSLYRRLRGKGKRGDVAMGHCMRKLLHLAFAVWKTNRPFDEHHFAWEPRDSQASDSLMSTPPVAAAAAAVEPAPTPCTVEPACADKKAAGHKRETPAEKVVTTAPSKVNPSASEVNSAVAATADVSPTPSKPSPRPSIDFAFLRSQITMEAVLRHLGLFESLTGRTPQLRGCCPFHEGDRRRRTMSVHLGKNLFHCFQAECQAQGNALDFWARYHRLPIYEAALQLAATFHLPRNREEAHVRAPVTTRPPTSSTGAVITADGP